MKSWQILVFIYNLNFIFSASVLDAAYGYRLVQKNSSVVCQAGRFLTVNNALLHDQIRILIRKPRLKSENCEKLLNKKS